MFGPILGVAQGARTDKGTGGGESVPVYAFAESAENKQARYGTSLRVNGAIGRINVNSRNFAALIGEAVFCKAAQAGLQQGIRHVSSGYRGDTRLDKFVELE